MRWKKSLAWQIEFTGAAKKQLKKIGHSEAIKITSYLRSRIQPSENPREYGKSLKGELSELWRYRVGNYRLICELKDDVMIVLVVRIGHRKDVYR